jgi:hypothetical protein
LVEIPRLLLNWLTRSADLVLGRSFATFDADEDRGTLRPKLPWDLDMTAKHHRACQSIGVDDQHVEDQRNRLTADVGACVLDARLRAYGGQLRTNTRV